MRVEYLRAHCALLFCRYVNQPENTAVWCAIDNREFSEILVQRDKNTFFGIGGGENIFVSGIFLPVAHPNGVMPGDLQIRNRPKHKRREGVSSITRRQERFYSFMSD